MKPTVQIALFGWPFVCLLFFHLLTARRAALASIILGWMFLPIAGFRFGAGIPEYNKSIAIVAGALLGILVYDSRRLFDFRPELVDLPMMIWCSLPFVSSVTNDLGLHDGFSATYYKTMMWGAPYLIGRLYLSTLPGMRDLALAVFVGGLIYVPFCLWESRMSPQLHTNLYGFHQHSFAQSVRDGGFRPVVFMNHGIMVSTWMAMASLCGIWLWKSRDIRKIARIPMPILVLSLVATTLLCRSMGAILLLIIGVVVLWLTRITSSKAVLILLMLLSPLYLAFRVPRAWSGREMTEGAAMINRGRSFSLAFRLMNEDLLVERALQRPIFGWGQWGRARVRDSTGKDISVTDSLWIIEIGNEGLMGLLGMLAVMMLPVYGLCRLLPDPAAWKHRLAAPSVALCVIVLLFLIDCLFNAMGNPAYLMAAGGLTALRLGLVRRPAPKPVRIEGTPWASPS